MVAGPRQCRVAGRAEAPAARPRSNSTCPAASRWRTAALSASNSPSSCAEQDARSSASHAGRSTRSAPRPLPEAVFTVRTYAVRCDYEPLLARKSTGLRRVSARKPAGHSSARANPHPVIKVRYPR